MGGRVDTGGLSTVLGLLGAAGRVEDGDGDQAELFEAPGPLPLPAARPDPTGTAGRPKGVRNKSTEQWARFLLSQGRSPLTVLQQLYSRPLGELVDELQAMADKHKSWIETKEGGRWERVAISPLEVLKMQRDAAVALAPYVHKRQPVALEVDQRQPGIVVLGNLDVHTPGSADDLALPLPPLLENQEVTELFPSASDDQKSETQLDQQHEQR